MVMEANSVLRKFNWHFIHPYIQVYQVEGILRKHERNELTAEYVNAFFVENFYNLDSTLTFIDGFFKRSVYFEPFNYFIENSLILCFQRDYIGAINILIPTIEGILSGYLTSAENLDLNRNRYQKIKKSSTYLKERLLEKTEGPADLVEQERKYYDDWFEAIEKFFSESLFCSTNDIDPGVDVNRHAIAHSLTLKPYDTLDNYIRLFNILSFLIWAFLQVEGKSVLNHIDTETFLRKRFLYEDLIKRSERLLSGKKELLKDYPLCQPMNFERTIKIKSILDGQSFKVKLGLLIRKYFLIGK